MKTAKTHSVGEINALFGGALGKKCWHVAVGGPTLPNFSLALGEKLKRGKPLQNPQQPKVFRHNEGEVSIFVRSVWRLEQGSVVMASSDDKGTEIKTGLNHIVGRKLVGLRVEKPAWDLSLEFSRGLRLKIFCERTAQRTNSRRNWQARIGATRICAGPGTQLQIAK